MALMPMAMYGLEVPAGDVAISARPDIPSAFRITMAAIDPSAEPEGEEGVVARATLKVIRQSLLDEDSDDDDSEDSDFDQEQMERLLAEEYSDESDEDDEDVNGGPSDPAKTKKVRTEAAKKVMQQILEEEGLMELDGDSEDDDEIPNGVNGIAKSAKALGKMPASDEDEDDDSEDLDGDVEVEEYVICTLDPSKLYQQPLDITFGEDEKVWFKVSGTHSIFLTGNYVEPINGAQDMFDPDSDEEEDYDLEPDMDELEDSEDESLVDGLDDLADPRFTEVSDDEEPPKLITAKKDKTASKKNKRPASDSEDDDVEPGAETLDELIAKEAKLDQPTTNGESKLSKKQLKKLKKNDGNATAAPVAEKTVTKKVIEADVPPSSSQKSDKKVSFAQNLEQGPTPTKESATPSTPHPKSAAALGVKTVQGVTLDDKKLGAGQAAKNGDRINMRYIGKLKDNNKVFDSNKKGKPFSFKLGAGEVIKGWEIGVQGMQAGGERRITIPAHLAYGSKRQGDIPANSALVFDVKLLEIGKK